eukprot:EST49155.1 Hypothetical protein SS50377_10368 [Spironucleus salmonicida]
MPKRNQQVRPLIMSYDQDSILPIIRYIFQDKNFSTVKQCLDDINSGKYTDVLNAFNLVNQQEIYQLVINKIKSFPEYFQTINWIKIQDIMYPQKITLIKNIDLQRLVKEHILNFKFFDIVSCTKFRLIQGIPQGAPLSPFLFLVWMDYKTTKSLISFVKLNNRSIIVRRYVDNIVSSEQFTISGVDTRQTQDFCGHYDNFYQEILFHQEFTEKKILMKLKIIQKLDIGHLEKLGYKYLLLRLAKCKQISIFNKKLIAIQGILSKQFPQYFLFIYGIFMQSQMNYYHNNFIISK